MKLLFIVILLLLGYYSQSKNFLVSAVLTEEHVSWILCFALGFDFAKYMALLKIYIFFVTVYYIDATTFPLSVIQAFSLSLCLQVTHIELLRRDCRTVSLPASFLSFT